MAPCYQTLPPAVGSVDDKVPQLHATKSELLDQGIEEIHCFTLYSIYIIDIHAQSAIPCLDQGNVYLVKIYNSLLR